MSDNRKTIETTLGRKMGASAQARELMAESLKMPDWRGVCRRCGAKLDGTVAELRKHECPK